MGLMIALWLFLTLSPPAAQKVDFRNFTYPIPRGKFFVPGDLKWMTNEPSVNITLADGSYVYAFSLAPPSPRLLGWLRTGAGGDSGLYHLFVTNGGFTIDVFDPDKRTGDCCSAGFMRTSYEWKDGKFIQAGPRRYGRVEKDPTPR